MPAVLKDPNAVQEEIPNFDTRVGKTVRTFSQTTATSGAYLWLTNTNWTGNTVPATGEIARIPNATTCTINSVVTAAPYCVSIESGGTLTFLSTATTGLTVTHLVNNGTLSLGTSGTPIGNSVTCTLTFTDTALESADGGTDYTPSSIDDSLERVTFSSDPGWIDGDKVKAVGTGSNGFTSGTSYWVNRVSGNVFTFHTSFAGGLDGSSDTVDVTTGSITVMFRTRAFDPKQHGVGLLNYGTLNIYGKAKKMIGQLGAPITANDTTIQLNPASVPTGWAANDIIFIPDTRDTDWEEGGWTPQWEYKTIGSISGSGLITIANSGTMAYDHIDKMAWGDGTTVKRIDIVQLRTNVILQSSASPTIRGHILVTNDSRYNIKNACFLNLGRTINTAGDPTTSDDGSNQLGRYPFHAHRNYWGDTLEDSVFTNEDYASQSTSSFSAQRWGCAYHDTGYFTHKGCVHHGMSGTGCMFAEDGNEWDGLVEDCVSVRIGGTGTIDGTGQSPGFPAHIAFVGSGFHGRSTQVRLKNLRAYNLPQNFSIPVYINNKDVGYYTGAGGGDQGEYRTSYPQENGYGANNVTYDPKRTALLEVDDIFACGAVDGCVPTFWHVHARAEFHFPIEGPGSPAPTESVVKNVHGFRTRQMSPIQYEMAHVTWEDLKCFDAGSYDWGDYEMYNMKFRNARLEGNSTIELPAVCKGSFIVDGMIANTSVQPIQIGAWYDINQGGKMAIGALPNQCDIYLRNVGGTGKGINMLFSGRSLLYVTETGSHFNDQVEAYPLAPNGAWNVVTPQRVHVINWGNIVGNNFRVWHNGQAGTASSPYSLFTETPLARRATGVEDYANVPTTWPSKTNSQTFSDDGVCAFSELMPTGAATHSDVDTGQTLMYPRQSISSPIGSFPVAA